ncbi:hypothetical protein A4R40_13860 [Photorhabdus laumondii subsp. laumondii]|nr:hypothetical protein A4R40_13860 [Photorhabdus laumondii subsp. laumondii]
MVKLLVFIELVNILLAFIIQQLNVFIIYLRYVIVSMEFFHCYFFVNLYLMDFKMDRDGKGANPREHR